MIIAFLNTSRITLCELTVFMLIRPFSFFEGENIEIKNFYVQIVFFMHALLFVIYYCYCKVVYYYLAISS